MNTEQIPVKDSLTEERIESACSICNEPFIIEFNSNSTMRLDNKRIYQKNMPDQGWCAFRCRNCGEPVHECVRGAEHNEMESI